ncbi:MAG: 50S ribosomal protein L25, partial [Epsilonproteobacteria bacterium]
RTVRKKETLSFAVNVGGNEMNVVVQSYESHPVSGNLLHVDLMVAQPGVVTRYNVPVVTHGSPVGLKNKGLLYIAKKRITLKGTIENIPNAINVDVESLDLGDSILIRDLTAIENTAFTDADRVSVLSIIKAK